MVMISNEEINAIRKNCNIVDIISSYVPVTLKGKDYKCVCPFHDDHSPSMSISTSKQIYKCFSCGAAGNVFTFVQNFENVSFIEAVKIVAEKIGYQINGVFKQEAVLKYQKEYDLMEFVNKYYENNINTKSGLEAKDYLHKRGLSDEDINKFRIGLSLDEPATLKNILEKKGYTIKTIEDLGLVNNVDGNVYDVFRGRIMFPLYDTEGHVIGYSARIYRGEAVAKYINTKETYLYKKGNYLYNYHLAKDEAKRSKKLIIVEGQMDAIRLYINGIKNVVALMGTALTKEQVELIKRLRCDVILGLDGDDAGKMATLKNGEILTKNNINVQVIRINLKKDPDEYVFTYGIDGYLKMINNPIDYLDFKLNTLKDDINPENTIELTNFVNKVLDDLKTIKDPIYIDASLTKLSKSTGIDKEVLKSRLNEIGSLKTITQEVFKKEEQIVPPSANLLDKITKKMLYYMLNDRKYVLEYQEKIGYFPNKIYRSIANEIVFFIGKNYNITVADFISYISYNEALSGEVLKIIDEDEDVSDEDFELVIKSYQRQKNKEDIEILKQKLASELDREHQLKILEQIKNIKKGSVE